LSSFDIIRIPVEEELKERELKEFFQEAETK
jgi:hypothetical protein